MLVPHPLYPFYAALAHRPGGITALTDQQLAAGMMWVPGSLAYTITFMIGFYRWLEPDGEARAHRAGAHDHLGGLTGMALFADDFLAGSLLSLLLPVCLLIAIAVWYVAFARRAPDTHPSSPALPPPDVVAAAGDRL